MWLQAGPEAPGRAVAARNVAGSQASLGLPSHIARVMHRPREGSCLEGNALPRLCRLATLPFSEIYLVQVLTGLPVNRAQHARRSVQAGMRHCRVQPLATRGHELWQTADGLVMMDAQAPRYVVRLPQNGEDLGMLAILGHGRNPGEDNRRGRARDERSLGAHQDDGHGQEDCGAFCLCRCCRLAGGTMLAPSGFGSCGKP